jgi:S-adenosylmethionine decarboxylase
VFFEGSEKKLELVIKTTSSLRDLGQNFWSTIVNASEAKILSSIKNESVHAYLLSESSLFVWDDRLVMITCGETKLIQSVHKLLETFSKEQIQSLIFQRKNEYCSHLQKTNFFSDISSLKGIFKGEAYRFGHLDSHHNFLYHANKTYGPPADDHTQELLMYHLGSDAKEVFCKKNQDKNTIRKFLKLDHYFKNWIIDDFIFDPFGYSINALKGNDYFTIHVTPQEEASYASFETNLKLWETKNNFGHHLLQSFSPHSFDMIAFNDSLPERPFKNTIPVKSVKKNLDCGYNVHFKQFIKNEVLEEQAIPLKDRI